jgi:NADH-quinone oxidoreductase subunit G
VLPGGRVSAEDAYAYAKFARTVLGTNDVDFRARPTSAEESAFLASSVVGTGPEGGAVTYADLERAPAVVLVALEPEDESPIVFLRLRKAFRRNRTRVYAVSPVATRGLAKVGGTLLPTAPGTEPEVVEALGRPGGSGPVGAAAEALREEGAVVLVGERAALVPGALSAVAALAAATGARLAWVPRRAGERGALEVGALPSLLPGGRPVHDPAARAEVAAAWEVADLPAAPGRDTAAIVAGLLDGSVDAVVAGGVDPADLGVPGAADAFVRPFVVSLEIRPSSLTEVADVVLPVAAHAEKAGMFVDWEGRTRPFEQALETSRISDYRALDMLADEMGEFLGTRALREVRAEMERLGPWAGQRPAAPRVPAGEVPRLDGDGLVLATWRSLLDRGSLQEGEPFLGGTAPRPQARVSAATAARLGVEDGDEVVVTAGGTVVAAPVLVSEMPDHVVWLPTNSAGCDLRPTLSSRPGALARVSNPVSATPGGAA